MVLRRAEGTERWMEEEEDLRERRGLWMALNSHLLLHSPVMDLYRSDKQPDSQLRVCSSAEQPVACSRFSTSASLSSSEGKHIKNGDHSKTQLNINHESRKITQKRVSFEGNKMHHW